MIVIKLFPLLLLVRNVMLMAAFQRPSYFSSYDSHSDLEEYIKSKNYIPNEINLPKIPSASTYSATDSSYILSKLRDEELLNLLKEQPNKSEYGLNDFIKVGYKIDSDKPKSIKGRVEFKSKDGKISQGSAMYRLQNKLITNEPNDRKYPAVVKLSELLSKSSHGWYNGEVSTVGNENKKEMLFDILVAELKSLCCKNKHETKSTKPINKLKTFMDNLQSDDLKQSFLKYDTTIAKTISEHMFLIINDDIKNVGNDELMQVDPESLEKNSSVLLLGPIATPLTDDQLKLAMNRISNEISKPEYLPLLRQLSVGELNNHNNLRNSFITGPETRRYIKPHRCNYQSKLAKVYGGPRWIICTGYINLNNPSLYD